MASLSKLADPPYLRRHAFIVRKLRKQISIGSEEWPFEQGTLIELNAVICTERKLSSCC